MDTIPLTSRWDNWHCRIHWNQYVYICTCMYIYIYIYIYEYRHPHIGMHHTLI